MNKDRKYKINTLQSDSRELSEEVVETQLTISFDTYFQKLLNTRQGVHKHHKLAMQQYAKGLDEATEEQFNEIFRSY